jgi:hypothetical protein
MVVPNLRAVVRPYPSEEMPLIANLVSLAMARRPHGLPMRLGYNSSLTMTTS